MEIEVDRHHLMIVGMGLIGQFLVEVFIIEFLGSFIKNDIDGIGG